MASKLPSAVRDLVVLVVVFGVILGGLFLYTGVWPPAVIVESGSMMHRDSEVSYGRIGTIDPGDMVLVKAIDDASEVETYAAGGKERYGSPGDVIVYYPGDNRARTPIIHRAMAWVDVSVDEDTGSRVYRVEWNAEKPCPNTQAPPADGKHCVYGSEGITIEELGLITYKPSRSGLVTKGDNPFTNARADQISALSEIVQPEWIEGKARGEIPWLGLIKLALAPTQNEKNPPAPWVKIGSAYAPKDLWVMLGVSLFVLVGLPVGYDAWRAFDDRRRKPEPPAGGLGGPGESSGSSGGDGGDGGDGGGFPPPAPHEGGSSHLDEPVERPADPLAPGEAPR